MQQFQLCVLGGSGFLGSEICRLIVAMGHRPVSVSRSGRPQVDQPWVEGVVWQQAPVLDAHDRMEAWTECLHGCEAMIHLVGIAAEDRPTGQTFARLHHKSAIMAAKAAKQAGVSKVVYLSAAKLPPGIPHAYLQAKLDAEADLERLDVAVAILRPTYIYAGTPGLFGALEAAALCGDGAESLHLARLQDWTRHTRGIRVEKIAMATLRAALQPETQGIFEIEAIDHLGDAMFIQS